MSQEWLAIEALDIKEVAIDFYKQTHNEDRPGLTFTPATIQSCEGDLILVVNAMVDYADLMDRHRAANPEMGAFEAATREYYAGRSRTIAAKLAAALGYDREATLERCRRRQEKQRADDIGEEALTLLASRGSGKGKKP